MDIFDGLTPAHMRFMKIIMMLDIKTESYRLLWLFPDKDGMGYYVWHPDSKPQLVGGMN